LANLHRQRVNGVNEQLHIVTRQAGEVLFVHQLRLVQDPTVERG
jgi:hypothetical protein